LKHTAFKAEVYTTPVKKRPADDNQSSPAAKKARRGEADDGKTTNTAFPITSVTKKSGATAQWKDAKGKFVSVDELTLIDFETAEDAELDAIQACDIRVEANAKSYNREYMIHIGRKRMKYLLTLDSPEECEDFFDELQPTKVERPLIGLNIRLKQAHRLLKYCKEHRLH
jgi:hypothetical protein